MSYFYGRDPWEEIVRMNNQLAEIARYQNSMDDGDDDESEDGDYEGDLWDYILNERKPSKIEEPSSQESSDNEREPPKVNPKTTAKPSAKPSAKPNPKANLKPKAKESCCDFEVKPCFCPAADVVEKEDSFFIALELPGVKKEDITIDLNKGKLAIAGSRKPRYFPVVEEKKEEESDVMIEDDNKKPEEKPKEEQKKVPRTSVLSCKCSYGDFRRVFSLPMYCQPEDVSAKLEDGMLYVTIQKPQVPEPRRIVVM